KKPRPRPGLSRRQVRERSVLRDDRGTAEVEAVDQGGHDGLNEEFVSVKRTDERARRAGSKAAPGENIGAIDPVILGEAILGLPGEVGDPTALILDTAAKEPTLDRAARKPDTEGCPRQANYWGEVVTNAAQMGFSVAAGEVGEEVWTHEPADTAADSPLRVDLFLPGKQGA